MYLSVFVPFFRKVKIKMEVLFNEKIYFYSFIAIIHSCSGDVINSDNKMIPLAYTGRIIWTNQRMKRKANTIANNL